MLIIDKHPVFSLLKPRGVFQHITSLLNGQEVSHIVLVEIPPKFLFYSYTQFMPAINFILCLMSLQPECNIAIKI